MAEVVQMNMLLRPARLKTRVARVLGNVSRRSGEDYIDVGALLYRSSPRPNRARPADHLCGWCLQPAGPPAD